MQYEVSLTEQALMQIQETASYISKILLEPETAKRWVDFCIKKLRLWIPCQQGTL